MLIISKKKDYYDGVVQTTGIDKTIVYNRWQNSLPEDDFKKLPKDLITLAENIAGFSFDEKKTSLKLNAVYIIGFCGKMYIAWEVIDKKYFGDYDAKPIITYDLKGIEEIISDRTWFGRNYSFQGSYKDITNYDPMPLHREHNAPSFAIQIQYFKYGGSKKVFTVNPILKGYKFYRIFDSFQALQEIQMFISGVLGTNENKVIEVADKYKIESHGFDKHSFRKEKRT